MQNLGILYFHQSMVMMHIMIRFITLLFLVCSFNLHATQSVMGSFEAKDSCPVYISKNKKTNPDNLMVQPKQRYQIKEINKNPPDWLRIVLKEGRNGLRWVDVNCGVFEFTETNNGSCDSRSGMADSHVLALSSQSGFCETYGYEVGKPECKALSETSYQAKHFTLHGLWPNQTGCGHHYGFCGVRPKTNHCDYSPVVLSPEIASDLKKLMPSYQYGSCLERHEWNKHGSCTALDADTYFALAMRLVREADESAFGKFITKHRGQTVKLADLRQLIAQSFRTSNADKIHLGCVRGKLVDVYIQLPALIPIDESLVSLINNAPASQSSDSCPGDVIISDFNKEYWHSREKHLFPSTK